MASNVIFESPRMFGELDSNGEIFMTGGVMDPKELYLHDLKDTKDSTSSSDSGISNLDDVADCGNVTDLHLDAEFKDLDFNFDFETVIKEENFLFDGVPKVEDFAATLTNDDAENFFNSDNIVFDAGGGIIIKSEPLSPASTTSSGHETLIETDLCGLQEQPISPDFYTVYDDGSLLDVDPAYTTPLVFASSGGGVTINTTDPLQQQQQQINAQQQQQQQQHLLQTTTATTFSPLSSQLWQPSNHNSGTGSRKHHGSIIHSHKTAVTNVNNTTGEYTILSTPLSPPLQGGVIGVSSPNSNPLSSPCSPQNSLPAQVVISPKSMATVITAPKFTQQQHLSSSSSPSVANNNILVLPHQIKQEVLSSPSSSPSSPLSSTSSSSISALSPPLLPSSSLSSSSSTFSIIPTKPSAAINLNAILSSKKKIQPKPGLENGATASQWLTSQVPLTTGQAIPMTSCPVINASTPMMSANGTTNSITDCKSMKRAQRIIKNRESASLSRKRKKEYLSSLEERLQQCSDENLRLQRENLELKQQLESLFTVNTQLKNPTGLSPAKKICLMCFALFLAINISGFSMLSSSLSTYNNQQMGLVSSHHGTGRQLLSLTLSGNNNKDDDAAFVSKMRMSASDVGGGGVGKTSAAWVEKTFGSAWSQQDKEMFREMNMTQATKMCAMAYINATESVRLAEQLTGWMEEEEKKRKKKEEKKKMGKTHNQYNKNGQRQKHYPPLRRFNSAAMEQQQQQQQQQQYQRYSSSMASREINGVVSSAGASRSFYPLQVFNGPDQRQQFLNAIPRRNDTFYVLSFSTDYLLVPASAHNKTMRPRMSLFMPVLSPSLNDSMKAGEESVAMMQIDCEILNTNLIHVHRSAFPRESTINGTAFGGSTDTPTSSDDSSNSGGGGNSTETDHESYWDKLKGSRK